MSKVLKTLIKDHESKATDDMEYPSDFSLDVIDHQKSWLALVKIGVEVICQVLFCLWDEQGPDPRTPELV